MKEKEMIEIIKKIWAWLRSLFIKPVGVVIVKPKRKAWLPKKKKRVSFINEGMLKPFGNFREIKQPFKKVRG